MAPVEPANMSPDLENFLSDGNDVSMNVRDFHVWIKENNEWKLVIDMWNSPAQPETPAGE